VKSCIVLLVKLLGEYDMKESFHCHFILDAVAPARLLTEVVGTHTRHPRPSWRCRTWSKGLCC